MSKNSKAFKAAAEKVDRDKLYTPLEAMELAKDTSSTKTDATVEVALRPPPRDGPVARGDGLVRDRGDAPVPAAGGLEGVGHGEEGGFDGGVVLAPLVLRGHEVFVQGGGEGLEGHAGVRAHG